MSPSVVRVVSADPGGRAELEDALRGVGLVVAREGADERADLAVYLDGEHPAGRIAEAAAEEWIAATVEALTDAVSCFRDFVSGSGREARAAIVVTSTDGTIGFAGRSVAASISAGLRGLLVSVVHEAAWLTGVLLIHPSHAPTIADAAPDIPMGEEDLARPDRPDTMRWVALEISRIADDPSLRRPGELITIAHERIV